MSAAPAALAVLAEGQDEDSMRALIDNAGPIAMAFVVALGIALYLLWRSLNKHMKRIDPDLPAGRDDREQALDQQVTDEAVARGEAEAAAPPPDEQQHA